jgi:uncharacterized protein with von Willebrand factor type A (vWA) domain
MTSYRYSRWDGTQDLSWLAAEDLMTELSEAMIDHGDLYWALRRLTQSGLSGSLGERLRGIQDMLQQLRRQKQQMLDQYHLDSVMDEFQRRLDEVVRTEREGIGRRLEEARQHSHESQAVGGEVEKAAGERDEDLLKALEHVAERNLSFLDDLPKDLAGAIKELADYEFMDADARRQFEELMSMLRRRITESLFQDVMAQLQDMGPQEMSRLKDMLKSLNQMLQEKMQGGEPDFDNFLKEFGQHFSGQPPSNLDELMDMLQRRMGQVGSLLDSLSPEERKALEDLMDSILQDQGLRQQLMELAARLEHLRPMGNLRSQHPFEGEEPVDLAQALRLMEELQEMGELERQLGETRFRSDMDNIDSDKLRRLLGEEAYQSLEQLKHLTDILEEAGYITKRGGRWDLTPLGIRRIGQKALGDIFSYMKKERPGKHEMEASGMGGDRADDTKRYEFGDPFLLQLEKTLMNSVRRGGWGTPLHLKPEDFEVYRTENLVQCATVLMLDMSWSMPMRGNFFAAKRVALALDSLIRTRFPRDSFYVVGFSDYATELKSEALPQLTWNEFVYGTNMQHGFMLSRKLLSKHKGCNRQIIMVTDGEPTAHMEGERAYFAYPPIPKTLEETLREAKRCARENIVINTFMLDRSAYLMDFINQLTKINRGRVFYSSRENLGRYILVDYIANKRKVIF